MQISIYYSKKCKHCYQLMKFMEVNQILQLFPKIDCIEDMSTNDISQNRLTVVPVIRVIAKSANGAITRTDFEKSNAFEWVNNLIENRRKAQQFQAEETRKLILVNNTKNRIKNDLFEYCGIESEGISDAYSHWKDNINNDNDAPHNKTFMKFGDDENNGIMTIPCQRKITLSSQEQEELIKKFKNDRENQDKLISHNIEKEQFNIVNQNQYI
jgi:hypothetical protein